jgi:TatD DNase family protein
MLGIGGTLTFKKSQPIRDAVAKIGLNNLILETDSPYLTPHPYRGKRNQPAYIKYIAEKLAEVLQEDLDVVADKTSHNAAVLLGWDDD